MEQGKRMKTEMQLKQLAYHLLLGGGAFTMIKHSSIAGDGENTRFKGHFSQTTKYSRFAK